MRKPLIAALGLVSFVFVADVASASDPKPLGAKITPEHLRKICAGQGNIHDRDGRLGRVQIQLG